MSTLNTIAVYWTIAMWAIGAIVVTFVLLWCANQLAWRIYGNIVSWPVICKAVREYKAKHEGEGAA